MCVGSEFQVDGAETENARKVTSDAGRSVQKSCVGRTSTCTPGLRCGILIFKRLILRCVCVCFVLFVVRLLLLPFAVYICFTMK